MRQMRQRFSWIFWLNLKVQMHIYLKYVDNCDNGEFRRARSPDALR